MSGAVLELKRVEGYINAMPEHHSVVKGSTVTYRLMLEEEDVDLSIVWDNDAVTPGAKSQAQFDKTGRTRQPIPEDLFDEYDRKTNADDISETLIWHVIYDRHADEKAPAYEVLHAKKGEIKIKWKYRGQHVIVCQLGYRAPDKSATAREMAATHLLYTQTVSDVNTVQRRRMRRTKDADLPNPFEELDGLDKYLDTIKAAEKEKSCPRNKRKAYERDLARSERYYAALQKIIDPLNRSMTTPLKASYVSKDTAEQVNLRICIQEEWNLTGTEYSHEVWLVDWTNPMEQRLRGRYWAKAKSRPDAIKEVIEDWRKNNEYYHPGNVVVEFPEVQHFGSTKAVAQRIGFNTPGKGFWGKLQEFLEAIGIALAIATAVVTFVLPIPGTRVVSGLIWGSVFTSSAAAGISIGRRKRNGFGNWKDDAFDLLTIVGNVFTAGQMRWARRAALASRAFQGQTKQMFLFGEVATDYVQGVLIASDYIDQFEQILDDPDLSPKERVDKMLEFARSAMISKALSYASVRGSKRKGRPDSFIDKKMQKRLMDPNEVVDLDAIKKQQGQTNQGELRTRVQDEPARAKGRKARIRRKRRRRGKFDFAPAPHPHKRGLRAIDDFDIGEAALAGGKIVLVRDSNPAMLKHVRDRTKGPKPLELKAKTLKEGKHAGLVAANPNDPNLKKMLQAMDPPMSYADFVVDLKKKGFRVEGKGKDYIVVSGDFPGGYYSDYDLHGVYTKDGRGDYSEGFRNELNQRFDKELVKHPPHDEWPDRNSRKAGPNRGPQPPVTAYVPEGGEVKKLHLKTIDDMRDFYKAWGIPWKKLYPGY